MNGEHQGNHGLTPADHDRIVSLEGAVTELRRDVGEDSSEGLRGRLEDHVKTCGKRWEDLTLELAKLEAELRGMGRMLLWAAGAVAFVVSTGLVVLGLYLKR